MSSKEIVDKIAAAGIVGLGGATFPTQVKLMPPPGSKAEIIIINAIECEPYLTSDHSLMMEKGEQILVGVTLLMKAVNVNKAVIGIENNKPDAIAHLTKLAAAYPGIEIMPLKVQYPQGGEKQLIDAVIRRQVKSGALPISAGAVVQNVGTAYAVYEAVQKNKPLFERVVTVTGKAVANPSNFLVRMGTPINTLIEAAGGIPENTGKIIGGGLEDLGKGLRSQVGTLYGTLAKGPRYLEMAEGYIKTIALDKNDEICGYEFVHMGKFMDEIKKGTDANEALKKVTGTYGRFTAEQGAVKHIDPRHE